MNLTDVVGGVLICVVFWPVMKLSVLAYRG